MASGARVFFEGLLGFAMPFRATGRLLLEQELRSCGVDPSTLPRPCLDEFIDIIVEHSKDRARRLNEYWKSEAIEAVEMTAPVIAGVLQGRLKANDEFYDTTAVLNVLRKHGVLPGKDDEMEKRAAKLGLMLHIIASKLREGTPDQFIAHFRGTTKVVASDDGREAMFGIKFSPARWYDIQVEFTGPNGPAIGMLGGGEDYGVFIVSSADEKAWVQLKVQPGKKPGQHADAMVRALLAEPGFKSMARS